MDERERKRMEVAFQAQQNANERYQKTRQTVLSASYLPFDLKCTLLDWNEHILDPGHFVRTGYFQLLPQGHYLHGVWKASKMLESITDLADSHGKEVTGIERELIRDAFLVASENRGPVRMDDKQREQLRDLGWNVAHLIRVYRDFKKINQLQRR
ncbi:MAG: hypothetical protein ACD_30C00005G0015 [uncultured bacterium]|uniref:Uncharacterized protein n=4 Tax=Candidatus Daviesiibacteriota TaxID=1752718 RepID=A0A0G0H5Y0_9BACT|nr:MAG: hypothetical protein ACD_30C00005G0015 [uncultured bacterium]KKQ07489.1 MAG: hypothetical protein US19_C0044G0006 [Candidatus Daviesbacteria bacterium GW2011_GWB1_36_5]KKQ14891.1 MAG: hypothetical protein US28_C0027G0003 [Candidatus Daviesbacteria bacterium GW2011_GWA1_36_8]OGE16642.1 MAG: hypothetical protein A2858_02250 [Candidatus Daviesbacteria bacterium RIFCSPHIGHO2_01_FULL_36_37]OGE33373.1 MAG: hypothetical protein A3C99_01640 [Candidatus Daviesbacteria bacterium RIFCSPHIGHO2_02_F